LLLAAGALAAETGLPDFLPPATKVMFGVQVRRILNSSLAHSSFTQEITPGAAAGAMAGAGQMGVEWQKIVAPAGLVHFKDIDEVLIACAADGPNQGQNPPVLVIARGNFNLERF